MRCTQYGTRARYWRSASIATIQPMTISSRTTTPVPQMLRVAEQRGAHDLQVVQQRVEFDDLGPAVGALGACEASLVHDGKCCDVGRLAIGDPLHKVLRVGPAVGHGGGRPALDLGVLVLRHNVVGVFGQR